MFKGLKKNSFRERFYELINDSDKTMKDLSKDLHVSNQTISAWKTGTRSPKEPTIIAIARHFNVNVEWLMGFDVPKKVNMDLQLFADPDYPLSAPEQQLVADYRALSPRGQQLLMDRAEELKLLYGKKSEGTSTLPLQKP